jgi:apolipoprotein N-acyltransferase
LNVLAGAPAAVLGAAVLGAAQTPAFVHTALWPLPLATLAALLLLLGRATPGRAALLGWAYGTGWLAAGVWWLFVSMHRYGAIPAPLAALAVLALSAFLALYLAAACAAFARWRRGRLAHDLPLFAALWLLAELARGELFTGFPWLAAGYAQVDAPLAALAPWVGVFGIGAAGAALAVALAALVESRGRRWHAAAGGVALLGVLAVVGPGQHTQGAGALPVTLLQTNIAQDEKFASERLPGTLTTLARELVAAPPGLVVAPETAIPLLPGQLDEVAPGYLDALRAHFAAPGRAALVGVPLGDFERGYTNSVLGLAGPPERGDPYRYDKHHLVPFGEFIPPGFRWFTDAMNIPLGDFARGPLVAPSFAFAGQRLAPNICYEDLFGEELARRFADAANAPTVFVNLSNIGWFGDTAAVPQHLAISRLRALEFQRPMLRATNTGATAAIDHEGRVTAALPPFTAGRLAATVEGRSGLTPYARWASWAGHGPLAALGAGVVVLLVLLPVLRARRGDR